jgi:uncharacterized protein
MQTQAIIARTQQWLERAVIGLNLCPFAKAEHVHGRIRYRVSDARTTSALALQLEEEIAYLLTADPAQTETTLLIHPQVLDNFLDYNDFLTEADAVLERVDPDVQLQIASFHPHYRFAGTQADDVENFTNRSPYPLLHLLREDSVDRAVAAFPEAAQIYERNIAALHALSHEAFKKVFL